jgi:signal transduction histidine kinase
MVPAALAALLIVDDETAQLTALCNTLRQQGYATVGVSTPQQALAALRAQQFDLLLTDLDLAEPRMNGIALLRDALEIDPDIVGILMTGQGTIATAVEAMKVGALDYILKPFKLSAVLPVISRALEMRRLRTDNARLGQSVRQRTAELEAANAELEAFSDSVSHDLRAPLRAVSGFSNILRNDFSDKMPEEARGLLDHVCSAAQRMEELIDDLLRFSRLGRQPLDQNPVDVSALVQEVLRELPNEGPPKAPHKATQKRIDARLGHLPDCVGDRSLLKQVFVNLLSNASSSRRASKSRPWRSEARRRATR